MIQRLLVLLLLLALSGCGFHLRGTTGTPLGDSLPELYIKGIDTEVDFGRRVAQALEANGVKLVSDHIEDDTATMVLTTPKSSRQVLSIDNKVRAREYALTSAVSFTLKRIGLPAVKQIVRVRRDLVVDPTQVLGSDQEERRLRKEMENELAQLLVLRLRSL